MAILQPLLPFGKFRIALIIFWIGLIIWVAANMVLGMSEVYPHQHLSTLLGAIGGLALYICFRLRAWPGAVIFLAGVASIVASAVVTYRAIH